MSAVMFAKPKNNTLKYYINVYVMHIAITIVNNSPSYDQVTLVSLINKYDTHRNILSVIDIQ